MQFSNAEGRALRRFGEDLAEDIAIRLDKAGFITQACANSAALGVDFTSLLLMPHISDLAAPEFAENVTAYCSAVMSGERQGGWLEFPLLLPSHDEHEFMSARQPSGERQQHWYALSLRTVPQEGDTSDADTATAAMGLLRSVQHKHQLASELTKRAGQDAFTGVPNRHAMCASLTRVIAQKSAMQGREDAMAIFAIDRLRAIFMQYGQGTADEIRWGFARYLETMTGSENELAQLDDERFGVILPGMNMRKARGWACDVLKTFAELTKASPGRAPELTASAGLARVEVSVDWTLRQAELGLVMARAGGGMQTGVCQPSTPVVCGDAVERAMEAVLQRAEQRRA